MGLLSVVRSLVAYSADSIVETARAHVGLARALPILTRLSRRPHLVQKWEVWIGGHLTPCLCFQSEERRVTIDLEAREVMEELPQELRAVIGGRFRYRPVLDREREIERNKALAMARQHLSALPFEERMERVKARRKAHDALREAGLGHLVWSKEPGA